MPTPDDHMQDPALARALRDLDLPGPAVPAFSASEVRRLGSRRRTRRRTLWAGSGLVAAALVGALVMGPLTPERGGQDPSAAGQPGRGAETAASPPQDAPGTPLTSPAPSATPSAPDQSAAPMDGYANAVVATLDIGGQTLTTHPEAGAEEGMRLETWAGGPAADVLTDTPQMLQVTGHFATYDLKGYGPDMGQEYAYRVPWVVTARTEDGVELFFAAPDACVAAKCPGQANAVGLIGILGSDWGERFYNAVDDGDQIEVVGKWGEGETPVTSKPPSATTGSRSPTTTVPTAK